MFEKALLDKVFKAYDIRGTVPDQLSEDFAYALGRTFVKVMNVGEVAVGHDMRTSSATLKEALIKGIQDAGANVIDLGMIPTDMLCFVCGKFEYEAGLQVTASHNPPQWNGFKGCLKGGVAISFDSGFDRVKDAMVTLEGGAWDGEVNKQGERVAKDHMDDWVEHVMTFIDVNKITPKKIVLDAGNGMAGEECRRVFARIPQIEMIPLYFEPDGTFPNHIANPIEEENLVDLKGKMEQEGADLGIAFDADADRVAFVDEDYESMFGTETTSLVAKGYLQEDPNQTILYNAICGRAVPETIEKYGGKGVRVRVGHSIIKDAMKEHNAVFGGEVSGHFFFQKNYNADSGIIMALKVLEIISVAGQPLKELRKEFQEYMSVPEIKFHKEDAKPIITKLQEHYKDLKQDMLDGLSIYSENWWANIRASNTEPVVKLTVEAKGEQLLREKIAEFRELMG